MARDKQTKRAGPQTCEACGREFIAYRGDWVCDLCGYDNVAGQERGKWFRELCTRRSVEAAKRKREGTK